MDGTFIEVATIVISTNDSRHRRDIKAEKTAANDGDGRDEVQIAEDHHDNSSKWRTMRAGVL